MARLPYSRVVNVTLTRADAYPSRRGFGVPLLITGDTVPGELDVDNRTKVYGSMEEVSVDWDGTDDVYLALEEAFGQNPRPMQIKVGYVAIADPLTATEANIKDEMDAIYEADGEWYWVTIPAAFRDKPWLDGLVEWVQAKNKLAILDSNDIQMEDPDDILSIAGRNKGQFDRTAIFYHDDDEQYPGLSLAALCGTFNFDQANSAYTAKFKKLRGVPVVNKGSAVVQAVTGFTPALGQALETGAMANTFIDIGGQFFVAEGSTLIPNVFIDEIHATDWIIARTEEETLGILLNNNRIPYTDVGMQQLASGPRTDMQMAIRAGLIADDLDPETGDYLPAITYRIPPVLSVPASQRKARIAPEIQVEFRYAGAIHYTTINYRMTF
jgi:hypothetical protein